MGVHQIKAVLLLGSESILALPVARALGAELPAETLIYTLSAKGEMLPAQRFSKHTAGHYKVRITGRTEFMNDLLEIIQETKATILLPVDEKYVRIISGLKSEIGKHISIPPLPDIAVFDSLVNKYHLAQLLKENNFPYPVTRSLKDVQDGKLEWNYFPCLLKPEIGSSGRNIFLIKNRGGLEDTIKKLPPEAYIIQEFVPGCNIDCSFLAQNGEIKAYTIQRGLQNRKFNFSTAIRFEKNEQLLKTTKQLVECTGYSGLAHLDYRLDERDGLLKLIDFNARFWVSMPGSTAAGVDFPLLSCLSALNLPLQTPGYREITYVMGSSTFRYISSRFWNSNEFGPDVRIQTDFWDRVTDPLPEVMRYSTQVLERFKKNDMQPVQMDLAPRS